MASDELFGLLSAASKFSIKLIVLDFTLARKASSILLSSDMHSFNASTSAWVVAFGAAPLARASIAASV